MECGDLYHSDGSEAESTAALKNVNVEDYYYSAHSQTEETDSSDAEKIVTNMFVASDLKVDVPEFIPSSSLHNKLQSSTECSTPAQTSEKATLIKSTNGRTQDLNEDNCNSKYLEQIDLLNARLALILKENEQLAAEYKKLKTHTKQQQVEHQKVLYSAESETNIIKTKFALYRENSEEKINQLQTTVLTLEQKLAKQENEIQLAHTILIMKSLDHTNFQENLIFQYLRKCEKTISNLSAVLPSLNADSYPTAQECEKDIIKSRNLLQKAKQFAEKLKEHGAKIIEAKFDKHNVQLPIPAEIMSEILNGSDLLHDNYLTAVRSLLKENMQSQTHYNEYNQWWNPYGYQYYKPPILPAAQYCSSAPQPGSSIIIKDVTKNCPLPKNSNASYIQSNLIAVPVLATDRPKNEPNKVESKIADVTVENEELKNTTEGTKIAALTRNFSSLPTTNENNKSDNDRFQKCDLFDPVAKVTSAIKPFTISSIRKVIPKQYDSESSDSENTDVPYKVKLPPNIHPGTTAPAKPEQQDNTNYNLNFEESKGVIKKEPGHYTLPEAVKRSGPSFANLYIYIRERIFGVNDEEVLAAITQVRRKYTKLSGMTKDTIVRAVKEELNGG